MNLSVFMAQAGTRPTWTVVYNPTPQPMKTLAGFVDKALEMVYQKTGNRQAPDSQIQRRLRARGEAYPLRRFAAAAGLFRQHGQKSIS